MKANVNDRVLYDGEVHTVLRVHVAYELDGICIPVDECDVSLLKTPSDEVVIDEICKAMNMTFRDIWNDRRSSKLTTIRYAIFYHLHEREKWSYRRIARASTRDHVTCFAGVRRFRELLETHDREAIIHSERLSNL